MFLVRQFGPKIFKPLVQRHTRHLRFFKCTISEETGSTVGPIITGRTIHLNCDLNEYCKAPIYFCATWATVNIKIKT